MRALLGSRLPLEDAAVGMRLLWHLPGFLRRRITAEEGRAIVRRRLEQRQADFLSLIRRAIYANPASPYRQLLALAGCEEGDLDRLVRREGVEGALAQLFRSGVYLSIDELKGRRPAVRGSTAIPVDATRLRSPCSVGQGLRYRDRGRAASSPVLLNLASIRDHAVNVGLAFAARDGAGWLHGFWGVPGGGAIVHLLEHAIFDAPMARWFSQVELSAPGLHPRYRWSARAVRWASVAVGAPLPRPQHVALDDPLPIAQWMAAALRAGHTPHLKAFASAAVRLCQAALAASVDLEGAQFTVSGEPITEGRMAAIRETGAQATPRYGASEAGTLGYGCLAPQAPDDVHFFQDLHALIRADRDCWQPSIPPGALLISSLRPSARMMLLNVSLGDQAVVESRTCGCPLERLGWTTHLREIRSFEKLTAGGMTFLDADVIRVLEDDLPARFGGGPTDYQLLEDVRGGQPRVRLLVHPAVGPLDEAEVADEFLHAIGGGSGVERVMELQWREAEVLQVERQAPRATAVGKVLHLHAERAPSTERIGQRRSHGRDA
jgi:hypothetical protein